MWFWLGAALAAEPVRGEVVATSGRTCAVALHIRSDQAVPVMLSMRGSGLYAATTDPVPQWYAGRVEKGELAYLVFDKPGVKGVDAKGVVRFDPTVFAAYTPQDLLDCADAALTWASARDDVRDAGQVLVGHSEGALVAASLAAKVLDAGDAERFATVVLTGFPVDGVKAAMQHQQDGEAERGLERQRKREARDLEKSLRGESHGFSAATTEAWWARGGARGPVATVIRSKTLLLVQHGIADQAIPVGWINTWAKEWKAPWLVVQLFDGGHNGNLSLVTAQALWVDHVLGLDAATSFAGAYRSEAR